MTTTMMTDHAAIGVYSSHTAAEAAVRMLEQASISLNDISLIGGDREASEASLGHYSPPGFVEHGLERQGEREGMWMGGLVGLLVGFGSFFLPGIGVLVVLGPLAGLLGGIGAGAVMGDMTGELFCHDISADYRDWLVAGNFLVIVHCTTAEEPGVKQVLESTEPLSIKTHRLVLRNSPQNVATHPNSK